MKAIVCLSILIGFGMLLSPGIRARDRKARAAIEEFCGRYRLKILTLKQGGLGDQLRLGTSNTQSAYPATIRDSSGREWKCWFIFGHPVWPFGRDKLEIRWDDPVPEDLVFIEPGECRPYENTRGS